MAIEKPQDSSQMPAPSPSREEVSTDIRNSERSLERAEQLVDEAIAGEPDLDDAAWQLTLAQWSLGPYSSFCRQWPRQIAMTIASAATVAYLTYRLFWTMNLATVPAAVFSGFLLAAELYAAISLGLYFFQVWRLEDPPLRRPAPARTVDVFVTTYNEDISLLRGTLAACCDMDYPHSTYVLDDGEREAVRRLAAELGVNYITRRDHTHAKAGNVNNALRQTNGEFVIVLDADHLPYRHFITRLMGYFDDPQMGFVQAPHTTYNLDNFMGRWKAGARAYWEDIRIFFEAVQLGKNRFGVACFCGSAAIFRRKALEDVGLFATETITEDLHTGMRINAAGWKSIAVSEEMVVGLAPDDAATFASQRLRWGEGNLSVLAYDNPLTMKGLSWPARINYFASISSWLMGPARLILYLTPLVMLLTGVAPVADMSVAYFSIVACYLVTVWTAVKVASNGCGQLLGIEMAMMASFHLQLKALWRALFHRRRQKFVVTKKRRIKGDMLLGLRLMWPQAALAGLSIVAVSWAIARVYFGISSDYLGFVVGSGLAMYHAWLAFYVLGRATAKRSSTEQWQHPICLAVDYSTREGNTAAVSVEFNENGCRLLSWERLLPGLQLTVTFHSPVGQISCLGRAVSSIPVVHGKPIAYLNAIVFEQSAAVGRAVETDLLREMILRYVVPVVTMTHRRDHQGARSLPEELSGEGDFPLPVMVGANQIDIVSLRSVALSLDRQGFLATLPTACAVGSTVQARLSTPLGPLVADVEVHEVGALRVGATIVHQHEFHWRDPAAVGRLLKKRKQWKVAMGRATSLMRNNREATVSSVSLVLAGYLIAVGTVLAFHATHRGDILFAETAELPGTLAQQRDVRSRLEQIARHPSASAAQLERAYHAAAAIDDDEAAAEIAGRLAKLENTNQFDWQLTRARHLVRSENPKAADAAFDQVVNDPAVRMLALEKQAEVYVEAARAAIAVRDLDKAVERFLQASSLSATDPEEAEELLGVVIAAKQTRLAIQVLQQLDRSDRVLRRIVDVYEMAGRSEDAVPELEELFTRHPDDAAVVLRLAELAVVRRDFTTGVDYYRRLHQLEPENASATQKLAETLLLAARESVAARRFEAAGNLFDESLRLQPPDDSVKREYAGFLATIGDFDRAIALLAPLGDAASRLQLAAILEMQGNASAALALLMELEQEHAAGKVGERSIARLLLADHRYEEALTRLALLLQESPTDPTLQREFIDAVAASEHWNRNARQTMVGVFDQYQHAGFHELDMAGIERLGDALRRLDMFEEARLALTRGVELYPESRRLRFGLAQVLGSLGRYDEAESQYKILLANRPAAHGK